MKRIPPHWATSAAALFPLLVFACQGAATRAQTASLDDPAATAAAQGCSPPPSSTPNIGDLDVRVEAVSSSQVTVSWSAAPDVSGYRIHIGSELAPDGRLVVSRQVATLGAGQTRHRIAGLAAGTDVFVRVAATGGEAPVGVVHARTSGGPGVALDGAVRSVHAFGPRTLLLVLSDPETQYEGSLAGNDGPAWQAGTWRIERADGRTLGVRAVHRESVPVGQPAYPVGFEAWGDDDVVDVEHRVFLALDAPLGSSDVFRVVHEGAAATRLEVLLPFSDRYLETPLVQLNQVGYSPRATKRWAYVSGWMGDGGSVDLAALPDTAEVLVDPPNALASRTAVVSDLSISQRASSDAEAGVPVAEIDLSAVPPVEGRRYRVRIPGVGVSFPTAVSEEAILRSFYTVARGLYHNRWCGDLDAQYTSWSRPEDHCEAFFVTGRSYRQTMFEAGTPRRDPRRVRGGHHDAGDFDIRPYHVLAGQYLLRAFEMGSDRFSDGQLTLPESGNGIPDLLDEALWSLAAWQDLQNPDGSIRAGVESHRHPAGVYEAHEDELPYWTFDPEPWHTAYVAALFAQGARLVKPFDAARADTLERAARAAYGAPVSQGAPDAYRMYAAGELFALTSERRFAADFEAKWANIDKWGRGAFDYLQDMVAVYPGSFDQGFAMADFVMGYAESDGADPALVEVIRREMRNRADQAATAILESPHAHRMGRDPKDNPDWGHTNSTGRHGDFIYQALELGGLDAARRQRYVDALSVASDYAMGANPLGLVYLTGLGSRSPQQPLHLDSLASVKKGLGPVPGIPVYGPVRSLPAARYYAPVKAAFHPAFDQRSLGRRYADSRTSVNTAEFTVWESQAPFAELFAALLASGMEPPSSWLPGGAAERSALPGHWVD